MTTFPAATAALQRGFWCFPCNPVGTVCPQSGDNIEKVAHLINPRLPYKLRWSEVATNNPEQVAKWWGEDPECNIGIPCLQSGLLVVDCDVKPGVSGFDQWVELADRYGKERGWEAFETYTVLTGSGGFHFYYNWPAGVKASQAGIAPQVDVRSNGGQKGGYVLGAGSVSSKGPYGIVNDAPVLAAPSWLVALCTEQPRPVQPKSPFAQPRNANFGGLVDSVLYAQEGNRSNALLWAARSMCTDGATEEEAVQLLVPATTLDSRAATDTIRSAFNLQRRKEGT